MEGRGVSLSGEGTEGEKLAREAQEKAYEIQVFVDKYRIDPANYLTTHAALDADHAEAEWFESVARALLSDAHRLQELEGENENLREALTNVRVFVEAVAQYYESQGYPGMGVNCREFLRSLEEALGESSGEAGPVGRS